MPVRVMIHWSVDRTFLAGVAFGILASATSAVIFFFLFIVKVLMCSHPEASLLLVFLLYKPTGSAQN